MAGVPAWRIGWMCQCGERLDDAGVGTCAACGTTYERSGAGIAPTTEGGR
jgi:UDP-2-acetamido-3-amino-2,3-dideoxy-glucuronate N-acetyltransferase